MNCGYSATVDRPSNEKFLLLCDTIGRFLEQVLSSATSERQLYKAPVMPRAQDWNPARGSKGGAVDRSWDERFVRLAGGRRLFDRTSPRPGMDGVISLKGFVYAEVWVGSFKGEAKPLKL